jgi:hypothetical protein
VTVWPAPLMITTNSSLMLVGNSLPLAVQLAAMDLNVLAGDVKATDLVFPSGLLPYVTSDGIAGLTSGGFIDVQ